MRRRLLWLFAIVCLFLPIVPDPPLITGAYLQNVVGDRATVAVITDGAKTLELEVWDPSGRGPSRFAGPHHGVRHAFEVSGLPPERAYRYKVTGPSGEVVGEGGFRTPPRRDDALVRFQVVGDTGGLPWWIWLQDTPLFYLPAHWGWLSPREDVCRVADAMAARPPHFWLHVGDMIYPWGEHRHYRAGFFEPFAELLAQSPCYPVLGNHDLKKGSQGRPLLENFHLPTNAVTGDERMYSFPYGAVRVINLDLNRLVNPETGEREPVGTDHPALAFLRFELERATEPWLVVQSHYPMHSASRQKDDPALLEHVLPLLEEYGVAFYFCGHDHVYQRFGTPAEGVVEVCSGAGGKSLYDVREHPDVEVARAVYHFCEVEVDGRVAWMRARSIDGELLDEVRVALDRDPALLRRIGEQNPGRLRRIQALLR